MNWAEAGWLKKCLSDAVCAYDIAYIPGSQKEWKFNRETRIVPIDEVYGLNNPNCNYAKALDTHSYFRIYKTPKTMEDTVSGRVFPVQYTAAYTENTTKSYEANTMTLVKALSINDLYDFDGSGGTFYGVSITGIIKYRYVAANGLKLYLVFDDDVDNAVLMQTSVAANSKTSTGSSYYTTLTLNASSAIPIYAGKEKARPKSIKLYVSATPYSSSSKSYVGYVSDIVVRVVRHMTTTTLDVNDIDSAFMYYSKPVADAYESSVDVDDLLYGIKTDKNFYNVSDGINYYVCDSVNIITGAKIQRVGVGTVTINNTTSYSFALDEAYDARYVCLYAEGCTFTKEVSESVITLTFETEYSGTLYWAAPLITEISSTASVTVAHDSKVSEGTSYNIDSGLLMKYFQSHSAQGDLVIDSFSLASENIHKVKNALTGSVPINGISSKLKEAVDSPEINNLANRYAERLNAMSVGSLFLPESSGTNANFHGSMVEVQFFYDDATSKIYLQSYLNGEIVTNTALFTDTVTTVYTYSLYKWTEASGYLYYYTYNMDTGYYSAYYYRPFYITAAGTITLGTAFSLGGAWTATVNYGVYEIPTLYDPQGISFIVFKNGYTAQTYDGTTFYDQTSIVYTLRTIYFRHDSNSYTNLNSTNGDTSLGTNYDFYYFNYSKDAFVYAGSGKTSTEISISSASMLNKIILKNNRIYFNGSRGIALPWFYRDVNSINSNDEITATTYYWYINAGAWRTAPTAYNYLTYSFSNGTASVDKDIFVPRQLCTIIRHIAYGLVFICFKPNKLPGTSGLIYVENWVDEYLVGYVYDPVNTTFYECKSPVSALIA